jgi:23S rRNA (guanosine2251-2'-O)-methyltransferase
MRIITGFHAIEEELRSAETEKKTAGLRLLYSKPGPRVKKILATATSLEIPVKETSPEELDKMVQTIPATARDHRGVVLVMENAEPEAPLRIEDCVKVLAIKDSSLVLILDSITDPHNVGAIIRSADQFGVDLVILPEHRGATDFEIISRTSAGASSWVSIVLVPNLVRSVELLKAAGFWVYGADAGGKPASQLKLKGKTALVMGSEGTGMARLLREKCDDIVSIPTTGKLDSLNVSVAAGILLYEIRRS